VWYRGEKCTVINGVYSGSWTLLDSNGKRIEMAPHSECRRVRSISEWLHAFRFFRRWWMTSWHRIYVHNRVYGWKICLIGALLLGCSVPAFASDFVQRGDYWIKDGWAYTKSTERYRRGHCWYTRNVYRKDHELKPEPAYVAPVKAAKLEEYDDEELDWRAELLELAKQLKTQEQEDKAFVEWANALGLSNTVASPVAGYSSGGNYGLSARFSSSTTPYAQQGATVYGYNATASRFSDVDLQTLFNQANQLALNSQQLTQQATGDFSNLVAQQSDVAGELDRIQVRGKETEKLIAAITEALRDRPVSTESSATINVTPSPDLGPQQTATPPASGVAPLSAAEREQVQGIISAKCLSCHGPDKQEGGWELSDYFGLDANMKLAVVNSLQGTGPSGTRMPMGGEPLSDPEIVLFMRDALASK
jgi:hypothetical protein